MKAKSLLAVAIILFFMIVYKHNTLLNRLSGLRKNGTKCNEVNQTSLGYAKPTARLINMYKRQVPMRQKHLAKIRSGNGDFARIYNNMAPEVFCAELVKVGTTDDGGKWMCGPFNLPDNCVIFSLGLSNDISFEEDIQMMTKQRCKIFSFDMDEQKPEVSKRLKEIRAQAMAAKITKVTNDTRGEYSLSDLMEMHQVEKIEILKIDIERSEFTVMEDFLSQHLVSQIMIEVHGNPWQTIEFLRMLSRKGYLLFNYEINGAYHQLCEYALIHESVLDRYGATMLAKFLI